MALEIIARAYATGSGGYYNAVRVNHSTKVYVRPNYEFTEEVLGNYFVQWDCSIDVENNTIYGSGYSYKWFNTLEQVHEYLRDIH